MNIVLETEVQNVLDRICWDFDKIKWTDLHQMAFTLYRYANSNNKKIRNMARNLERLNQICLDMEENWFLHDVYGEGLSLRMIYNYVNDKNGLKFRRTYKNMQKDIDNAIIYSAKELLSGSKFNRMNERILSKKLAGPFFKKRKKQNNKIHYQLKKDNFKWLKIKEKIKTIFSLPDKIRDFRVFDDVLSAKSVVTEYLEKQKNNVFHLKKIRKAKKVCQVGIGAIAVAASIWCVKFIGENLQKNITPPTSTETNLDQEDSIVKEFNSEQENNIVKEFNSEKKKENFMEKPNEVSEIQEAVIEKEYIAPGEDITIAKGSQTFNSKENLVEQTNGAQPYYDSSLEIGRKTSAVVLSNEDEIVVSYNVADIDSYIDNDYEVEGYIIDNQFSFVDGEFVSSEGFYLEQDVSLKRELKR